MNKLDVKDCEFDNPESCYHLTRGVHEKSISKKGLGAHIGIRSKDKPLLEMLVTRFQQKSIQQLGQETLEEQKDTAL